jgi:hypothetical protein
MPKATRYMVEQVEGFEDRYTLEAMGYNGVRGRWTFRTMAEGTLDYIRHVFPLLTGKAWSDPQ